MKKRLALILMSVMLVLITLTGCMEKNTGEQSTETESGEDIGEAEEPIANMINPMVEYPDDSSFEDELGFAIDASFLPGDKKYFIIGKELADIRFTVPDPDGRDVECMLRGTKNDEGAANPIELIAGIYATDLDETVTIDVPVDEGEIAFNITYSEEDKLNIAYWDYNDVHYTFTAGGGLSQMTLAALYDQIMCAIGARTM